MISVHMFARLALLHRAGPSVCPELYFIHSQIVPCEICKHVCVSSFLKLNLS